jgi:hypothetical protein
MDQLEFQQPVNHPTGSGGQQHNPENPWRTTWRSHTHPMMPCVAIQNCHNSYHLWATTNFENAHIINDEALCCHPPSLQSIIRSLQDTTTAKYVRTPLAPGTASINLLLMNLCHNMIDPSSITFEDAAVSWYSDLLLHRHSATDTILALQTGSSRHLMSPLLHTTPHNIYSHKYICPCSMFAPVLCFTPSHHPLTKLT